jgi:hypothetical protein
MSRVRMGRMAHNNWRPLHSHEIFTPLSIHHTRPKNLAYGGWAIPADIPHSTPQLAIEGGMGNIRWDRPPDVSEILGCVW